FGRQLPQGGLAGTPRPQRHQGQEDFPGELGGAPDKPRAPRARFNLVGRKKLCYLFHYTEPMRIETMGLADLAASRFHRAPSQTGQALFSAPGFPVRWSCDLGILVQRTPRVPVDG